MRISDWSSDVCSSDLARRVLDMLLEHAIHGVPETLSKDGQVILERRKFNTRAMMWIVQQRFPEQYGGSLESYGSAPHSLPDGLKKLRDRWRQEWEEEQGRAAAEADPMGEGSRDAILAVVARIEAIRSEEHTSELQSLIRTPSA